MEHAQVVFVSVVSYVFVFYEEIVARNHDTSTTLLHSCYLEENCVYCDVVILGTS